MAFATSRRKRRSLRNWRERKKKKKRKKRYPKYIKRRSSVAVLLTLGRHFRDCCVDLSIIAVYRQKRFSGTGTFQRLRLGSQLHRHDRHRVRLILFRRSLPFLMAHRHALNGAWPICLFVSEPIAWLVVIEPDHWFLAGYFFGRRIIMRGKSSGRCVCDFRFGFDYKMQWLMTIVTSADKEHNRGKNY